MEHAWAEAAKQFPLAVCMMIGFVWVLRFIRDLQKDHAEQLAAIHKENAQRLMDVANREADAAKSMVAVVGENNKALGSVAAFMALHERDKK